MRQFNPRMVNNEPCAMTMLVIDATGLSCPLPFLKLRRALREMASGVTIEVLSTDPLAPGDFAELCAALGHRIVGSDVQGAVTRTRIEVLAAACAVPVGGGG